MMSKMSPRKIMWPASLVAATTCLALGYGMSESWQGLAISVFSFFTWLFARKTQSSFLISLALAFTAGLAAVGLLLGAPALLMIFSATAGLACWDLVFFESGLKAGFNQSGLLEKKHDQTLARALGIGLVVASLGHYLEFQIPFLIMVGLVVLALFSLDHLWRTGRKAAQKQDE